MIPRRLAALAAAAALGLATGCYQAHHAYNGPKLLTTGAGLGTRVEHVRHFRVQERQLYVLYGLVPVGSRKNGAAMAAEAAGEYDGVVNLRLADGQDLLDMAFSNLVCGLGILCGSWSVWAEGDVVRIVGEREQVWIEPAPPAVDGALPAKPEAP